MRHSRWREAVSKLVQAARSGTLPVVIAGGLASALGVLVVLMGARELAPEQLSRLALVQLVVLSAQAIQRAAILSPALASQRISGRAVVPLAWTLIISIPSGLLVAAGLWLYAPGSDRTLNDAGLWALAATTVLGVDVLRHHALSSGRPWINATADGTWICGFAATFALAPGPRTPSSILAYWAFSGLFASIVWAVARGASRPPFPRASLAVVWRLGRWSLLEQTLSVSANLLPIMVTYASVASVVVGRYRLFQTSLGPLNLINASLVTILGLQAWTFVDAEALLRLTKKIKLLVPVLSIVAFTYLLASMVAIRAYAGHRGTESDLRIMAVVCIAGVLGAATSPLAAASLALGRQRTGAIIRAGVVSLAVVVSSPWVPDRLIPWGDRIGTVALGSAVFGFFGWAWGFRQAARAELRLLGSNVNASSYEENLRESYRGGRHG